jgi:hypothetical protein
MRSTVTVTVAMALVVLGAGCCSQRARDTAVPTTVVVVNPPWFATPPLHVADESAHGENTCGRELLVNGDFESPALSGQSWNVFTSIDGWRASFGPGVEIQRHVAGTPHAGEQYAELDSHASSGIYQDVSTQEGETYELRFAFTARAGTSSEDNHLRVLWNGREIADLIAETVNPEWRAYRFRVRGREGTSRLELQDAGPSNSLGTYVDSVGLARVCRS